MEENVWKKLDASDRDAFFRLVKSEEVARYMRFDAPENEAQAQEIFNRYLTAPVCFGLWDRTELAGVLSFGDGGKDCYDLSLFWDSTYWNRGFSTQTLQKAMDFARQQLKAQTLKAHIVSENRASCRLVEKQGFTIRERFTFPDLTGELLVYQYDLHQEIAKALQQGADKNEK